MVLQVQNLCKEYPQFSLRDISFQLPEGAIMGLIGENGAGKSTTMRMILGMAQPDSGQISVFGHRGVTPQDRESIGVVFDEMPFNQTLYTSHLGRVMKKIYSQWDESAYNQYLQRFSLPDKKEIKDFSRGMKMKLSLAIALSHGAQLLILDERVRPGGPRRDAGHLSGIYLRRQTLDPGVLAHHKRFGADCRLHHLHPPRQAADEQKQG